MLKKIEYTQAREILLSQPVFRSAEQVGLEKALDRVLAEDLCAPMPVPNFDKSPFDGFAFRACDVPGTLEIAGESSDGTGELPPLRPKTAVRIFTGAPVPEGADAVIKAEDATVSYGKVMIDRRFAPGTNIIRTGETIQAGSLLLEEGRRLSPANLGMLASVGIARVPVYKKPRVFLANTGSELVNPGTPCPKYGIYNSSYYSLSAVLRRMRLEVTTTDILIDDREQIERTVGEAMESDADIVMTTGGASIGDYDFALRTAKRIGAETLFWKVNIKPGGALLAAAKNGKLYLALSGNPAAALMSLLVVIQPFLRKLTGAKSCLEELYLPMKKGFGKTSSDGRLLCGHLLLEDGKAFFVHHEGQSNNNLGAFAGCELIGLIPANAGPLPAGNVIQVLRLPSDLRL